MRKFVPFVAVALFAAAPVQAQESCPISAGTGTTCNVPTTATMTMPVLAKLTLSATSATLATPDSAGEFNASGVVFKQSTGPTYSVRANRSWQLMIEPSTENFTAPTGVTKVAGDVAWSLDQSNWTVLSATSAGTIESNGTATADLTPVQIYYRTKYTITNDKPGSYSLGIKYTLTAN